MGRFSPRDGLDGNIALVLDQSRSPGSQALLSYYEKSRRRYGRWVLGSFAGFTRELQNAVTAPTRVRRRFVARHRGLLAALGLAAQLTIIDVPKDYPPRPGEQIDGAVAAALLRVLEHVEEFRRMLALQSVVMDLPSARSQLEHLVRRANGEVWLPLRSLIAAPLETSEELGLLYARTDEKAERLATHVVSGDGVVLVTGYRGAGKSTFVNMALTRFVPQVEGKQTEDEPWHVVPVFVNLATVTGIDEVLRRCVRSMYRTFLQGDDNPKSQLLTREEQRHLMMAHMRSSFNVNLVRSETVSSSREIKAALDLKVSDMLPVGTGSIVSKLVPGAGVISRLFPSVSASARRERKQQMESTIGLLDYDEDRAEEDIVAAITMMSKPRPIGRAKRGRLKLVFVFDETDKLELETGQLPLLRKLKNLFLTRDAVFLFVTSKEFYYKWMKGRQSEDSLLGSYFSDVYTVPLFASSDTERLLRNLMLIPPVAANEPRSVSDAIRLMACYLTYQATGLPREIVRRIRSMQAWNGLQPFLTDNPREMAVVRIYAAIQNALEDLSVQEERNPAGTEGESGVGLDAPSDSVHLWLDEDRLEQIRWGLYVLVETLLSRGSTELHVQVFQEVKDNNFSLLSDADFESILERIGQRLHGLRVQGLAAPLFTRSIARDDPNHWELTVSPEFYLRTGRTRERTVAVAGDPASTLAPQERLNEAHGMLEAHNYQRAFFYLKGLEPGDITPEIYKSLYRLFMSKVPESSSNVPESFRVAAAQHLMDSKMAFFQNFAESDLDAFLAASPSEPLLGELVQLVRAGASADAAHGNKAVQVLRSLLATGQQDQAARNGSAGGERPHLSDEVFADVVEAWLSIAGQDEAALMDIVGHLPRQRRLPDKVMGPLVDALTVHGMDPIRFLLDNGFRAGVSDELLRRLLEKRDDAELVQLWSHVMEVWRDKELTKQAAGQ